MREKSKEQLLADVAATRQCVTCGESGHTYMECPTVDFVSLFTAACGVQAIGGQPFDELVDGIEKINTK